MPLDFLSGHYLSLLLLLFIDCRLDPFLQITGFSRGRRRREEEEEEIRSGEVFFLGCDNCILFFEVDHFVN